VYSVFVVIIFVDLFRFLTLELNPTKLVNGQGLTKLLIERMKQHCRFSVNQALN
jgi:hypothetical protein